MNRLAPLLLALTVILAACEPSPPEGQYVDVFLVQTGECFWRQYPDSPQWSTVKVVRCGGNDWQFAVISRFVITAEGPFPSAEFLEDEAFAHCAQGWTSLIAPTEEAWARGVRDVICLMEPGAPVRSARALAVTPPVTR